MWVLLLNTYELGHQPLHVASPAAALRAAGHEVRCVDLAVERWHDTDWAEKVNSSQLTPRDWSRCIIPTLCHGSTTTFAP